jgi:hypothetical protein
VPLTQPPAPLDKGARNRPVRPPRIPSLTNDSRWAVRENYG